MATYGSTFVDAPVIQPYSYGLLDTVTVLPLHGHEALGTVHESEYCGIAANSYAAACAAKTAAGTISASVGTTRNMTLTLSGVPAGAYPLTVSWGDGASSVVTSGTTATHTYTANGTYVVSVSGAQGYTVTAATATVTNGSTTGPFTGNATSWAAKTTQDGVTSVEGRPFTVYHLFTCRTVGEWSTAQARALKALQLGEHIPVELGFQQTWLNGATDVTPGGTAVDIVDGLAILEQSVSKNYTGQATIHMSRATATRLMSRYAVYRIGDHLETCLGSLVVAGAGYDMSQGPSAPAATSEWMFGTGAVVLRQGEPIIVEPTLEVTTSYTNQFSTMAERQYTASVECVAQAVEVNQKACCP